MEKNTQDYFGAILNRVRKQEGRSLKELADILGTDEEGKYNITPSYLNRLEKGEKENPSFKMVCLMIEKLGLNPVEVFKCFGFENILKTGHSKESERIEDIIRTANILIPIDDTGVNKAYLTQEEKEFLITMIKLILKFYNGSDDANTLMYIVGELHDWKYNRHGGYRKTISIGSVKVDLFYDESINKKMELLGVNEEVLHNSIEELGNKLFDLVTRTAFVITELGVVITLKAEGNLICIKDIVRLH